MPSLKGECLSREMDIAFEWVPGRDLEQKRACIVSWHAAAREQAGIENILEISTRSENPLGRSLSAFNLALSIPGREDPVTVECAYQGSKVFEHGGPFTDLLGVSSWEAKKDPRLTSSGSIT
nr:hypothetical protein [Salipiger mucosus]